MAVLLAANVLQINKARLDVLMGLHLHGPYTGCPITSPKVMKHHYVTVNYHLKQLAKLGLVTRKKASPHAGKGGFSYNTQLTESGQRLVTIIHNVLELA